MDLGWTEWLFDTHEFKYTPITPAELAAGNLGAKYDVIVFGSQNIAFSITPSCEAIFIICLNNSLKRWNEFSR